VPHTKWCLLILTDNEITEIRGLSSCRRLKYLSLGNNKIDRIQGLDCLPLKFLSLVNCCQLFADSDHFIPSTSFVSLSTWFISSCTMHIHFTVYHYLYLCSHCLSLLQSFTPVSRLACSTNHFLLRNDLYNVSIRMLKRTQLNVDIRALWRSALSVWVLRCQKLQMIA